MGCNVQKGSDPANFSSLVREKASYSNPAFSETAKAVVDIECSINVKEVSGIAIWADGPKAHHGEVGFCGPIQVGEGSKEYVGQVTPPTGGGRGAKGVLSYERVSCREGIMDNGSDVGRKVSPHTKLEEVCYTKGV